MAEPYGTNGAFDVTDDGAVDVDVTDDGEINIKATHREETLFGVFHRLIDAVFFPGSTSAGAAAPLFRRIKNSLAENGPLLREASTNSGRNVLLWTRRGSPLRALLVISVGTITLISLQASCCWRILGPFLCLCTAIYIGALSVAVFVISATTISAIAAVLITTGWIGFFWIVWLAAKKSLGLAKQSFSVTGSAISAYSYGRHAHK
ncbi:uncharacterized protein Pyn_22101 [Prunus yedoensis var. nudiflora]|uniref:Uncharacterized protein n=1 Tax=Prunus yedoensis var. nudiflora TaxID=2094558 RepID=A0A314UW45_PRUYE|nr:uncharacterized protein Pyn_22101 [Prunus yedoensis var. nudiflora]